MKRLASGFVATALASCVLAQSPTAASSPPSRPAAQAPAPHYLYFVRWKVDGSGRPADAPSIDVREFSSLKTCQAARKHVASFVGPNMGANIVCIPK